MRTRLLTTIVSLAFTALSCGGDTIVIDNKNEVEVNVPAQTDDNCGNSPWYGMHLWEVADCKWGFYMAADCMVKVAADGNGYQDKYSKWDKPAPYNGTMIEIVARGVPHSSILDPDARFADIDPLAGRANEILDQYAGGILKIPGDWHGVPSNNVFISQPRSFDANLCKQADFFLGH